MIKITVIANTPEDAAAECKKLHGWTPDAVREVDSGEEGLRAYMCFESAQDALLWDAQK